MKIGLGIAFVAAAGLELTLVVPAHCQAIMSKSVVRSGDFADRLALPPPPDGKSTILGGEIHSADPVRDELVLKVYGQKPWKILFDERTQVYRDGKKISTRDLGPVDHASVQTLLDGTDVYALSIHILSATPEGEYQGRVLSFARGSEELTVTSSAFHESLKLRVPAGTPITRVGQPGFASVQPGSSDLVPGTLVAVKFESDKAGRPFAKEVSVLAAPGSVFVFIGNVAALDMHSGMLQLADPNNANTYRISFRPSIVPESRYIHNGDHLIVTASFNGANYEASAIKISNDGASLDGMRR